MTEDVLCCCNREGSQKHCWNPQVLGKPLAYKHYAQSSTVENSCSCPFYFVLLNITKCLPISRHLSCYVLFAFRALCFLGHNPLPIHTHQTMHAHTYISHFHYWCLSSNIHKKTALCHLHSSFGTLLPVCFFISSEWCHYLEVYYMLAYGLSKSLTEE